MRFILAGFQDRRSSPINEQLGVLINALKIAWEANGTTLMTDIAVDIL